MFKPFMFKRLLAVIAVLLIPIHVAFAALDINTASADDFDRLKGIGPVKAKAIVDYRAKNGPFKSIEDIKKVSGIGGPTFEAIKGDIAVVPVRTTKGGAEAKGAAKGERAAEKK